MPDIAPIPIAGPFLTSEAPTLGVDRRALDGPAYRTVFRGVAVASSMPDTVVIRARAALLVAPEGAVISHWTAARLWGGVVPDNEWTHVAFMRDVRSRVGGIKLHRFRHRLDTTRRHGMPVTSPSQTFCHLARHLGLVDLVALGDRFVKKGRCSRADLVSYADGWVGQCRQEALDAARLVRDRVDSVPETALRVLMVLAGLPEPGVDIRIHDADGTVRFRLDLGYEEAKLAIEYDGRWHDKPEQAAKDEARRTTLSTDDGWTFAIVTADDLFGDPEALLATLQRVMQEHGIPVPARLSDTWRAHFRVRDVAA